MATQKKPNSEPEAVFLVGIEGLASKGWQWVDHGQPTANPILIVDASPSILTKNTTSDLKKI